MKPKIYTFAIGLFLISVITIQAQMSNPQGGEVVFNSLQEPCLSAEDHERYLFQMTEGKAQLDQLGNRVFQSHKASQQVLFDWPVRQASGYDFASTWSISNYVDHDPATNQLQDWNCGNRTYDTSSGYDHTGIDIYTWPFWWKQMDDNQSEVIAAQAGQIIYKNDGEFDKNCSFNGNNWNAIFVEHSDGSVAWYGHLKNGSLNSKGVGEMLVQGEYIGVIGSSGNSTGPHLHFEVYDSDNNLIDPYEGPCNDLNNSSWWQSQKSYTNPKINTVLTHSAPPEFYFDECNTTEEPNVSENFDPGDTIILAAYYADQTVGTTATYEVRDPEGGLYATWSQTFTSSFFSSYWYWTDTVNDNEGVWTFSATYNDDTVIREFTVGENLSITDTNPVGLMVFPNPVETVLNLKTVTPLDQIIIRDVAGKEVLSIKGSSLDQIIDFSEMSSGVYFLTGFSDISNEKSTLKIIKQ